MYQLRAGVTGSLSKALIHTALIDCLRFRLPAGSQEEKNASCCFVFLHLHISTHMPCLLVPLGPKCILHTAQVSGAVVRLSSCAPVSWIMTHLVFFCPSPPASAWDEQAVQSFLPCLETC